MMIATTMQSARFQSTHPARGATEEAEAALRRGQDFNPRTPRGVRRRTLDSVRSSRRFQSTHPARGATAYYGCFYCQRKFQSTHPARGATDNGCVFGDTPKISIHAPREGCDGLGAISPLYFTNFNPRTPRGVRPFIAISARNGTPISIHAPREGCDDRRLHHQAIYGRISIHAPREGCDCFGGDGVTGAVIFQSTHPARGAT